MPKKYELTDDTIKFSRRTLYRIRALVDIREIGVKKGDLGGYIEKESNLSHIDNAWVRGDAKVFGNALVMGNALVTDNARVYNKALVCGNAIISGNAKICENAIVSKNARVYDNACIHGNAIITGNVWVHDNTYISTNGDVYSNDHYVHFTGFDTDNSSITFYRVDDVSIDVESDQYTGNLEGFIRMVNSTYENTKYQKSYLCIIDAVKYQFKLK